MKAVILAAGKGSRISRVSQNKPKCLLPIENTTLIGKSLKIFWSNGIKEIVIVTGYKSEVLEKYLYNEWPGEIKIVYNSKYETTNVLYSFSLAVPYLIGHDFIFHHADTVFDGLILEQLIKFDPDKDIVFAVQQRECGAEEMKVKVRKENIISLSKEMPINEAYGEFLGIARIKGTQIENINKATKIIFEHKTFQAFFELAIQYIIDKFKVEVKYMNVNKLPWCEIDFPEDYEYAKKLFEI